MADEGILSIIERQYGSNPESTCFYIAPLPDSLTADAVGCESVTYAQLRERSARLARAIDRMGVHRGDWCASDMANCAAFVYLMVAAAIGGFSVVTLNTRLTGVEKAERLHEVVTALQLDDITVLDEQAVEDAIAGDLRFDEVEAMDIPRWMRRGIASFSQKGDAFAMFTSGTSGRPKAAPLTWGNVIGAAQASNASLNRNGEGLWQLALPLYHVGGMEIVMRSLLNESPFILYRKFDAEQVLLDATAFGATHVSVVDKMLHDLLEADDRLVDADGEGPLARYECILLGGAAPNSATLHRALSHGVRVFASYGMTETCSQIASRLVTTSYDGTLTPLPGYKVTVVAPDEAGRGQLAVKGPGIIGDYLNAHARFTADGYFLTGDSATMVDRCIKVAERTEDMFVSGGENIYPEEIRAKLLQVPGITDAYVFGDEDPVWGRRPVAVVEAAEVSQEPGFNLQLMTDEINLSLSTKLSRLYRPDRIIVVPDFPRTGIGKTNRHALRHLYNQRIDVRKVEIWRVKQPFVHVVHTAKAKLRERESLMVRVTDWNGRTGVGEDVAFSTDWYLPETIDEDVEALLDTIVPLVNNYVFVHPSQASVLFRAVEGAAQCPMACAALESALWDLYGKVTKRSIVQLIGGRGCISEQGSLHAVRPGWVPGGAVVGTGSKREVVDRVRHLVEKGYTRVKMKVKPGRGLDAARKVREEFPNLVLVFDANQSFTEEDAQELKQLDALNPACIEEPLDPKYFPKVGPQDFWARLVRLQRDLKTPVCLDESWTTVEELKRTIEDNPSLRCVAMKLGKFGGVQPALEFYWWARERGIMLWMGGMYDTGVSKRLHAAFSTLPGMNVPGDISDTANYFATDVSNPPFELVDGMLQVNPEGHEYGLGCELDDVAVDGLQVQHWCVEE